MQECGFDFDTGCGNDFIMASFLKLFFIIAILGVRGGGGYAWPGWTYKNQVNETVSYSFILSNKEWFYQISEKITECWKYMYM